MANNKQGFPSSTLAWASLSILVIVLVFVFSWQFTQTNEPVLQIPEEVPQKHKSKPQTWATTKSHLINDLLKHGIKNNVFPVDSVIACSVQPEVSPVGLIPGQSLVWVSEIKSITFTASSNKPADSNLEDVTGAKVSHIISFWEEMNQDILARWQQKTEKKGHETLFLLINPKTKIIDFTATEKARNISLEPLSKFLTAKQIANYWKSLHADVQEPFIIEMALHCETLKFKRSSID